METKICTLAGTGTKGFLDADNSSSMFRSPFSVCCTKDNQIFVSDREDSRVRVIYRNHVRLPELETKVPQMAPLHLRLSAIYTGFAVQTMVK
jgi:hypothetical protein